MGLFGGVVHDLLVFGLADHVAVEVEDFLGFKLARVIDVEQTEQALADVLRHLDLVPLDVVLRVHDLIKEVFELVIVEERAAEHLGLDKVDPVEEDLEGDELLLRDSRVLITQLLADLDHLQAELLNISAGKIGKF